MNIIISIEGKLLNSERANSLLNAGLDIICKLKTIDTDVVSETVYNIFTTLTGLVECDNVTNEQFEEKKVLSKCIEIFQKNDGWHYRSESVMQEAIEFFDSLCRWKKLVDKDSDYELLVPLLIFGMKQFPESTSIRKNVLRLIEHACETMKNKKLIEKIAMEGLSGLFARNDINEVEMTEVRTVMRGLL